ncbi:hypothetical protein [Donghicola sp.]|jgi:hypothetical protein|uniref:hypothetical protein n=1 Tax=Donghicola sp. TaxID=1929294 RepID=UPI0025DAEE72|nr:hypothetical protein [Donghicola sp.]MCT4579108.1 hypothetical protein [Donghicola sp.]
MTDNTANATKPSGGFSIGSLFRRPEVGAFVGMMLVFYSFLTLAMTGIFCRPSVPLAG